MGQIPKDKMMALQLMLQAATVWMILAVEDVGVGVEHPATQMQVECKRYSLSQSQVQLRKMQEILSPVMGSEVGASAEAVQVADESYKAFMREQIVGFKGVPVAGGSVVDVSAAGEVDEVFTACWDSRRFNAELQRVVLEVLTKG
jgi:hypothetical protein